MGEATAAAENLSEAVESLFKGQRLSKAGKWRRRPHTALYPRRGIAEHTLPCSYSSRSRSPLPYTPRKEDLLPAVP